MTKLIFYNTRLFVILTLFLWGPLFSETIVLEKGDVYVGNVISEDEKRITLSVTRALIKKENIPATNSTEAAPSPQGGRQFILIFLLDGSEVKGIPQYLANGDVLITGNPYLPENIVIAKREIKNIHFNPPPELKMSSSKSLPGQFSERAEFIEIQFDSGQEKQAEIDKKNIRYRNSSIASFAEIQNLPGQAREYPPHQKTKIQHQITVSGSLFFLQQDLASFFSYDDQFNFGGYFNLGYQIFPWPISNWYSQFFPAFGINAGYLFIERKDNRMKGFTVLSGPNWAFRIFTGRFIKHRAVLGFQAGMAFLQVAGQSGFLFFDEQHVAVAGSAMVGYQLLLGRWGILLGAKSSYIYDPNRPFISIEATLGLSYLF